MNWLEKVGDVKPESEKLRERFGDDLERICSGDRFDLAQAAMMVGLNAAIDRTNMSPRKRRRVAEAMTEEAVSAMYVVYVMGYAARMDEEGEA
jgi:hypothetical protein